MRSFATHVADRISAGWRPSPGRVPQRAVLQTHCHEHSVFGPKAQRAVLEAAGLVTKKLFSPTVILKSKTYTLAFQSEFGYDTAGRMTSLKFPDWQESATQWRTGETFTYSYDAETGARFTEHWRAVPLAPGVKPRGR